MPRECGKLLKVSEHSTSDEKFVEAVDNACSALLLENKRTQVVSSGSGEYKTLPGFWNA
jgi:hypothetical protein